MVLSQPSQVAGDGAGPDEKDAIGEVLAGQQAALAEGLLAEIRDALASEGGWPARLQQAVILLAPVQRETDGLLGAFGDGLAGRPIPSAR